MLPLSNYIIYTIYHQYNLLLSSVSTKYGMPLSEKWSIIKEPLPPSLGRARLPGFTI